MSRPLRLIIDVAIAVLLVVFGFVLNDLEHGVTDVPNHWWSSLAVLLMVAAVGARWMLSVLSPEDATRRREPGRGPRC